VKDSVENPSVAPRKATGRQRWLRLLAVLSVAAGLKLGLLALNVVPFNADEAVVGLMARHILQGERPVFFYGQAYMGSLDAWLVAGAFALFGQAVWVIRLVQVMLYLATVATTYWLGLRIYGSQWIAGAAALFLAIPPVLVTLYTTVTLGGYGEAILLGNLMILLALALLEPGRGGVASGRAAGTPSRAAWHAGGWLLLGALAGLGFWGFPIVLVYVVPVLGYAVVSLRDRIPALGLAAGLMAAGFALGASPWLSYTARHGLITVSETLGSAIAGASSTHPVFAAFEHLFYFLLFGLTVVWGMRPPWGAEFLALPLVPFALAVNVGAMVVAARRLTGRHDRANAGRRLLAAVLAMVSASFVLTPFGADPSGRYFLPMAAPIALFLAEMLHWLRLRRRQRRSPWRKWFGQTLALVLVAFYWWGNVQAAARFPPGLTTQFDAVAQVDHRSLDELMMFLQAQGETRGYTNYWVEYPLAFRSGETLIFEARLPYHADFRYTARDSRLPRYAEIVAASDRVAYITTRHPALDAHLREGFARLEVTYREQAFGDFRVFYGLSRAVAPQELGLGEDCCAR
jgi:4-amino-4-deoxy-L-arabinose transferase-like glycosyltransferase